jgi:hypothetical protein
MITHFSEAVIPPPLCAYKLHCDLAINNLIWSPYNLDLLIHLMNNEFVYYRYQQGILLLFFFYYDFNFVLFLSGIS